MIEGVHVVEIPPKRCSRCGDPITDISVMGLAGRKPYCPKHRYSHTREMRERKLGQPAWRSSSHQPKVANPRSSLRGQVSLPVPVGPAVEVTCWCEKARPRMHPLDAVARGETWSCGRPSCTPDGGR